MMQKNLTPAATRRKREYDAPAMELLQARVELGFAGSGAALATNPQGANEALTAGSSYDGSDFD